MATKRCVSICNTASPGLTSQLQFKKRRYNREGEDTGDQEQEQAQSLEEKLKDATTLYVGNL